MRQMIDRTKLVSHRMHVAQTCVVKGHAAKENSINHSFTGFYIMTISDCSRQIFLNQLNGANRQLLGHAISARSYQGFHSMGQSIHPSRCR